jgi:uncharacterized integral membrane protein
MFFLFLALIMALVAVVFALTNTDTVTISILVQEFQNVPIALVVLISVVLGMLIAFFGFLPSLIRNKMYISGQRKKITTLEKGIAEQKTKVEQLQLELNPPVVTPTAPVPSTPATAESAVNPIDPMI